MLLVLTSPEVVAPGGRLNAELVRVLTEIARAGNRVAAISNHAMPQWFSSSFAGEVDFVHAVGRQSGQIVTAAARQLSLQPCDTLVLAGGKEDLQMGKNGRAVVITAGWAANDYIASVGIDVNDAVEFKRVVELCAGWSGSWWWESCARAAEYQVKALADLSGINQEQAQRAFAARVKTIVKNGGPELVALLAVLSRSLLMSGYGAMSDLVVGVYPSSTPTAPDAEVLSSFAHRLRTTISRYKFAKFGEPLFVRHRSSTKRSMASSALDRTDPSEQIETIHLNPWYRKKLSDRNVVVLDDCTTYGVSFGVATCFLRKAGAASVTGVALGKFGDQLRCYDIALDADPFGPVRRDSYRVKHRVFGGITNRAAQKALHGLLTV